MDFWVSHTLSSATRTSMPASPAWWVKMGNSAVLLRILGRYSLLMLPAPVHVQKAQRS